MMTTGTTIMIVCAVLYGLIVVLFRKESESQRPGNELSTTDNTVENIDAFPGKPGLICSDGTPGTDGLLASDFDRVSSE